MRFTTAALAALVLAGCGGGPYPEQEKQVKAEVVRYFAELNAQAGARMQEAKAARTDIDLPPTSLVVNTYDWDLAGTVYENVTCSNSLCGAAIATLVSLGSAVRCPACNTDLTTELAGGGKGKPMFEIRSGTSLPIVVVVRYVRHARAYDPNSLVSVSAKTEATNPIKPITEERGTGYYAGGFYRDATTTSCVTGFVFDGGLNQIDPESVKKLTADPPENVSVGSMKLGRWGAVEKPVTPWLGRKPSTAAAPKEEPKNP